MPWSVTLTIGWLAVAGIWSTVGVLRTVLGRPGSSEALAGQLVAVAVQLGLIYLLATRRNWARILYAAATLAATVILALALALSTDREPWMRYALFNAPYFITAILLLMPPASGWYKTGRLAAA
jgi:hypothetical protein